MIIFYFSGTGNSRYVAELFSHKTGAQAYSIEQFREKDSEEDTHLIRCNERIAFCYPIYGSCVPSIMADFVKKHRKELEDKKLIIFCTQYLFSGNGAEALLKYLPGMESHVIYAEHFRMPNNLCNAPVFKIHNGSSTHRYQLAARTKMNRICHDLGAGIVKKRGFSGLSRLAGKSQSAFWPSIESKAASGFHADEQCNSCGLCVKMCPVNNLTMTEHGVVQNDRCMVCYRCINGCPQKAVSVLFSKKPKVQYKGLNQS